MTQRLSLAAFLFGLVATTSIGFAAGLHRDNAVSAPVRVIELQRVEIHGKRLPVDA